MEKKRSTSPTPEKEFRCISESNCVKSSTEYCNKELVLHQNPFGSQHTISASMSTLSFFSKSKAKHFTSCSDTCTVIITSTHSTDLVFLEICHKSWSQFILSIWKKQNQRMDEQGNGLPPCPHCPNSPL